MMESRYIWVVILAFRNISLLTPRGLESYRGGTAPCLSKLRDEQGPAKQGCQAGNTSQVYGDSCISFFPLVPH